MTEIVLVLILFCILLLLCLIFAAAGFLLGARTKPLKVTKPPPEPISKEKAREIRKRKHEEENFLKYDGTEQEDFYA